jgi:subfamily B ATP-binding cassette protein MsbA
VLVIDWRLSLFCFLTVPLIVYPVTRIGRRVRRLSRQAQEDLATLNDTLQETYSGVRIVQAFGREGHEADRFGSSARRLFDTQLRWVRYFAVTSPLMEVLGAVTVGALLLLARQRIQAGAVTPEMMMVFVVALIKVYQPVKRLAGIYSLFQQALGASERVFGLLDTREQVACSSRRLARPRGCSACWTPASRWPTSRARASWSRSASRSSLTRWCSVTMADRRSCKASR